MHPELRARYDDSVRDRAASLYGATPDALVDLGGFENFVYEFTSDDDEDFILRVSHSVRRTEAATLGELDWVHHLASHGVPVAAPVFSQAGNLAERIDDGRGGYFVASAFQRAPGEVLAGRPALRRASWGPRLFREWGRVVAYLHVHSADYAPSALPVPARVPWYDYDVVDVARFVPHGEAVVIGRARALVDKLRALPIDPAHYGLIHADLTESNFCFHEGRVTVFDFDNCEYAWFVKDVAVILYYVATALPLGERAAVVGPFLADFLAGYRGVRPLSRQLLETIPDWLELQRLMNYALFHQYLDPARMRDEDRGHWRETRAAIEGRAPILPLDFASFGG